MTFTDEQLVQALRALAPPTPELDSAAALRLTRAAATPSARNKRRKSWLGFSALVAAIALAIPTVSVAEQMFAAQTGRLGGNGTEEMLGDEWISSDATDFPAYVASLAPRELATPDGFNWEATSAEIAARYSPNSEMQRIGIRADYERTIWVAWIAEWIEADRVNDDARRSAAFNAMLEAPTWEAAVETDGGGMRMIMWEFLLRAANETGHPRADTMQALWQFEKGPAGVDEPPGSEYREHWDEIDRQALIEEVFSSWEKFSEPFGLITDDSPMWAAYDRELDSLEAETRAAWAEGSQ